MSHSITDDIFNGLVSPHRRTNNVTGQGIMNRMRRDTSAVDVTRERADEDMDHATHTKNYFLVVVFHKDVEKRPCRPVLRLVTLAKPPDILEADIAANPHGSQMVIACQLCDASLNSTYSTSIDLTKFLCSYALSVTDQEAVDFTNNISRINTAIFQNTMVLSERSNMLLMPTRMHRYMPQGCTKILHMQETKNTTDTQMSIIALTQSLNPSRSLCVKIGELNTYLATPENLHDSLTMFMRKLDPVVFKSNTFKFMAR
jgi:hypothetical protein